MTKNANDLLIIVRQYLSTVFGNSSLVDLLKSNESFAITVAQEIGIHNNLEAISNSETKITDKYIENYEKITSKKIDLKQYEHFQDLDDIQDQINYLNVLVKNLFNQKDLSEFELDVNNNVVLEEKSNTNQNLNEPQGATKNNENEANADYKNKTIGSETVEVPPLHGEKINGSTFNSKFQKNQTNNYKTSDASFAFNPFIQTPNRNNLLVISAAKSRLSYEIEMGKIYRWSEKPRGVYLLQYFALAFSIIFVLASLAVVIGWIYATNNGLKIQVRNAEGNITTVPFANNNAFSFILPVIIIMLLGIAMIVRYSNDSIGKISNSKKNKIKAFSNKNGIKNLDFPKVNQNLQYHMYINSIVYTGVAIVALALIPVFPTTAIQVAINIGSFSTQDAIGLESGLVLAIFVLNIIFLSSFVPLIIIGILAKLLNPKEDTERLQQIINNYAEEMKKQAGKAASGADDIFGPMDGGIGSGFF